MNNNKSLFLNIGYKCNFNCIYCVIGGIQKEFSSDDFVSIEKIKEIDLTGYKLIWLTGGEPTIHPQIFEILNYLSDKGLDIHMQTNGSMLGNSVFFDKIKKYNITYQLPLNSNNEKVHNTIMMHKNAFNLTLLGIKNLLSGGFVNNLTVKIILTKLNYKSLEETIIFLNDLGVKKFYVTFPVLKGNYRKYLDTLVPKYSEIKIYLDKLGGIEKSRNIKYVLESFPYCVLEEGQYKNVWEIGQFNKRSINALDEKGICEIVNIANNCFKKHGYRSNERDCSLCKIIILKEELNNISFLHKKLDKEINANCLDNIHKTKQDSCLKCNYNLICAGISKEYIELFGFKEFKNDEIKDILTKDKILNYINYVRNK